MIGNIMRWLNEPVDIRHEAAWFPIAAAWGMILGCLAPPALILLGF